MADLVVCADGTWNTPDDKEGDIPTPTNVVKLSSALVADDKDKYYHTGVGTEGGWWERVAGGGMGLGLDRNIMSGYRWLAGRYRPKDRIFLFGFSRGAYTVRSLGGMISQCGLLDLSSPALGGETVWAAVEKMFAHYRVRNPDKKPPAAPQGLSFHNAASDGTGFRTTPIYFIGVWDTVGSLGIPDDLAFLNLIDDPVKHSFHDTELSDIVEHARHAVAADELRQSFAPTLWTKASKRTTMKQVWFPGVHSDVGGGYAHSGLADGALKWMIDEAKECGLKFRDGAVKQIKPDPRGLLHDSLSGVFKALKTRPRNVPRFAKNSSAFHRSALDRHRNPPLNQSPYWKTSILAEKNDSEIVDVFARQRWSATGIFLEAGIAYDLTATGQWLDASIKCGPGGTDDGQFHVAELTQIAASGLGKLENLFGKITGNVNADFWWTKRAEDLPWFALVGVVANSDGAGSDGKLIDHESVFEKGIPSVTPA